MSSTTIVPPIGGSGAFGRLEADPDRFVRRPVCDSGFGDVGGNVACRQLEFESGVAVLNDATGDGTDLIALDNLSCANDETSLFDCTLRPLGSHTAFTRRISVWA